MAIPRKSPFIWVTWLAKAMAGEYGCLYGIWFQVHNQLTEKRPSDFDLIKYQMDHSRLLTELTLELADREVAPLREIGLACEFPECGATLKGKVDCALIGPTAAELYDCKTGKEKQSDLIQVLLYMYMLGRMPAHSARVISGAVVYADHRLPVPHLPEGFEENVRYFVEKLSDPTPLPKSPGEDCRFCNLTTSDCPECDVSG